MRLKYQQDERDKREKVKGGSKVYQVEERKASTEVFVAHASVGSLTVPSHAFEELPCRARICRGDPSPYAREFAHYTVLLLPQPSRPRGCALYLPGVFVHGTGKRIVLSQTSFGWRWKST